MAQELSLKHVLSALVAGHITGSRAEIEELRDLEAIRYHRGLNLETEHPRYNELRGAKLLRLTEAVENLNAELAEALVKAGKEFPEVEIRFRSKSN